MSTSVSTRGDAAITPPAVRCGSPIGTLTARTRIALTVGEEARLGRIQAGFAADITVFANDPVECDPDELPELPVVLTVVDGEIVYRAD